MSEPSARPDAKVASLLLEDNVREHHDETSPDEPDDGWVTSPTLWDTEISTIALCKYAGIPVEGTCHARATHRHPDEPCVTLFFSAEALQKGELDLPKFEDLPVVVR